MEWELGLKMELFLDNFSYAFDKNWLLSTIDAN